MNKKNFKGLLLFLSLFLILTVTVESTFAFIVTNTSNVNNTFKPYEFNENDLIINKTLELFRILYGLCLNPKKSISKGISFLFDLGKTK